MDISYIITRRLCCRNIRDMQHDTEDYRSTQRTHDKKSQAEKKYSVSELPFISVGLLAVRVSRAERVAAAPASGGFSPALVAFLPSSSALLTPRAQLQIHLLEVVNSIK